MTRNERFAAAAATLGLRQKPLAALLGIAHWQYISAIARGVKTPSEQLTRHIEMLAQRAD